MIICFYVSSHGFGHATRACRVVAGLLALPGDHQVHIVSGAPEFIFLEELDGLQRWSYRKAALEPAVVQPKAYTVDREATVRNLLDFLAQREVILNREANWLRSVGAQAIAVDAPFLPCAAAKKAGIPAVAITNFTFDAVYEGIHSRCPSSEAADNLLDDALESAVRIVTADYAAASVLLCLPGHLPGLAPAFDGHSFLRDAGAVIQNSNTALSEQISNPRLIHTGLVSRKARLPRGAVLQSLRLPAEAQSKKILLVNFGGQALDAQAAPPSLPEGWVALVCGPASSFGQKAPNLFFAVPRSAYMPDVLVASDLVLGKLGYGTVSECLFHLKPFIYVPRTQFVEEKGLEALIHSREIRTNRMCAKMDRATFEKGRWDGHIRAIERSSTEYFAELDEAVRSGAVEDYERKARDDDAHIVITRTFIDLVEKLSLP